VLKDKSIDELNYLLGRLKDDWENLQIYKIW
jgi:hypothetical protein